MAIIKNPITLGGPNVSTANAAESDVLVGKTFYAGDTIKKTGTIQTYNGATTITENSTLETAGKYVESNITINVSGGGDNNDKHLVQVIDYDGTVLDSKYLNTGDIFYLPDKPTHEGLTFQNWSSPVEISWNTISTPIGTPPIQIGQITVEDSDITIGATYTTASGLSEFDIELTKVTGLDVTFNMVGNKNWGDGTTNSETTHTYADYGKYTITCDGTEIPEFVIGQSNSVNNYTLTNVRLGNNVTNIVYNSFKSCMSLTTITITNSVTNIGNDAFKTCRSLVSIVIPESVTSIKNNTFYYCNLLTSVAIPLGVTSIGGGAFAHCYSLTSINILNTVTSIGSSAFSACNSLTSINIPNTVTTIGGNTFQNCVSLTSINIPSGVTSIGSSAFSACNSLTSINIPNTVTSIGASAFNACHSLIKYDFSSATKVPTLSNINAFNYINKIAKIIVPDVLYDTWIAATNWTTYANYIYKASEVEA